MRNGFALLAIFLGACATTAPAAPSMTNAAVGVSSAPPAANSPQPPMQFSQNAEANALYLEAQDRLSHGDPRTGGTFANARAAIALYEQAIGHDPQFALAYVQIARAWLLQGYSNPDAASATDIETHSRSALARALQINPNLADAHALAATVYYTSDYDWTAAEREYRWIVEHDPRNAAGHAGYAAFLATMGRFDEALHEAGVADSIRNSPADLINRARIQYDMRDYEAAAATCRQALSAQDNQAYRFFLGLMLLAQGSEHEAIAELEHAAAQGDNAGASLGLAYAYARVGRSSDALGIVARVRATHREDQIPPYRLAAVQLALGDRDGAIDSLRRDRQTRGNWSVQLKVDPVMDPLRNDERFRALLREMRFPE